MCKRTLIVLSVFFACFLGGCVSYSANYSQKIADDLASQCSSITTERSMIQKFGSPTNIQYVGDMTIYTYKWSVGMFHGNYSSYEVYKSCEIIFQNGIMINYRTHAQT